MFTSLLGHTLQRKQVGQLMYDRHKRILLYSIITCFCDFAVNKQLADKERVAAALENSSLLEVVNQCLSSRGH